MKYRTLFVGMFLSVAANLSHATLIHQYDFNGNAADSLGGRSLDVYGEGTYNDNSTYSFRKAGGFELNEKIGSVYSLDLMFQFSSIDRYTKVLDFSNLMTNIGLYTLDGSYYLYRKFGQPLIMNQPTRLTWVRDAASNVSIYQDGVLINSFANPGNSYTYVQSSVFFFLNDSYQGLDGYAAGSVDYIRVYNNALTAEEINPPTQEPQPETPPNQPSSPIPEPASVATIGVGLGLIGLVRRRRARVLRT